MSTWTGLDLKPIKIILEALAVAQASRVFAFEDTCPDTTILQANLILEMRRLEVDAGENERTEVENIAAALCRLGHEVRARPYSTCESFPKIQAIKALRLVTNRGLRQAKEDIETAMSRLGIPN